MRSTRWSTSNLIIVLDEEHPLEHQQPCAPVVRSAMASRVQGGRAAQAFIRRAKAAQRAAPESVAVGYFPDQRISRWNDTCCHRSGRPRIRQGEACQSTPFFRQGASPQSKRQMSVPNVKAASEGRPRNHGAMALSDAQAGSRRSTSWQRRSGDSVEGSRIGRYWQAGSLSQTARVE